MMNRRIKLLSVTLAMVIALAGLGGVTAARADDATSSATATPEAQATGKANGVGKVLRNFLDAVLDAAAQATKLDRQAIVKELRSGKTLAEVITEHGATVDAVKSAAKTAITQKVNQAVTDGKITQDQANKLLNRIDTALDKAMQRKFPAPKTRVERILDAAGFTILMRETSTATNLSMRDVLKELRSGKTLAQIATEHNADVSKIVSEAVQKATDRINKMVSSGKLKQDQADKLLATLSTDLTKLMNDPAPFKRLGKNGKNPTDNSGNATQEPAATPGL